MVLPIFALYGVFGPSTPNVPLYALHILLIPDALRLIATPFQMFVGLFCSIGRKSDEETVVRPLTTSNLELVENQGGPQGGQR